MGQLYAGTMGEYRKAIRCYRKALLLTDDQRKCFDIQRSIAKAYYFLGDLQKAKSHALIAMQHFQDSGQGSEEEFVAYKPRASIHLEKMGWLYACLGQEQKAQKYFSKMEQQNRCSCCRYEKCFESRLYQGDLCRIRGEKAEAGKEYQETLRRNPHCNEAMFGLSKLQET
jgi:tetratricopeptide (TPR) repeat protein